jgi:hypothetical protein
MSWFLAFWFMKRLLSGFGGEIGSLIGGEESTSMGWELDSTGQFGVSDGKGGVAEWLDRTR